MNLGAIGLYLNKNKEAHYKKIKEAKSAQKEIESSISCNFTLMKRLIYHIVEAVKIVLS